MVLFVSRRRFVARLVVLNKLLQRGRRNLFGDLRRSILCFLNTSTTTRGRGSSRFQHILALYCAINVCFFSAFYSVIFYLIFFEKATDSFDTFKNFPNDRRLRLGQIGRSRVSQNVGQTLSSTCSRHNFQVLLHGVEISSLAVFTTGL